jgi:hypothetical protein
VPPFVGHDDPPCLPSARSEGGCYSVGFTQRGGFVRQDLASPVSNALLPTFEMKKVPWHTQLGTQRQRPGDHYLNRQMGLAERSGPRQMAARHAGSTSAPSTEWLRLACARLRPGAGGGPRSEQGSHRSGPSPTLPHIIMSLRTFGSHMTSVTAFPVAWFCCRQLLGATRTGCSNSERAVGAVSSTLPTHAFRRKLPSASAACFLAPERPAATSGCTAEPPPVGAPYPAC